MTQEQLKQILLDKGLKYVDIESEKDLPLYVRIWFDFRWSKNNFELQSSWDGFTGINEEDVLKKIDKFLLEYQTGDWIIELKK